MSNIYSSETNSHGCCTNEPPRQVGEESELLVFALICIAIASQAILMPYATAQVQTKRKCAAKSSQSFRYCLLQASAVPPQMSMPQETALARNAQPPSLGPGLPPQARMVSKSQTGLLAYAKRHLTTDEIAWHSVFLCNPKRSAALLFQGPSTNVVLF